MWGWISRAFGAVAGKIDDTVRHWVHDLINGLYGFLHLIFLAVSSAWDDVFGAARSLWDSVNRFCNEAALAFYELFFVVIPKVIHYMEHLYNVLVVAVRDVLHWAAHEFDLVRHWVAALVDATRRWVLTDIWAPIWRTLSPVFTWVTHEGAVLWHYLTHPADLVDLLWNYLLVKLEREAWTAGRLLGRFFLSLVVHNVKTFAILIEDIVTAIL